MEAKRSWLLVLGANDRSGVRGLKTDDPLGVCEGKAYGVSRKGGGEGRRSFVEDRQHLARLEMSQEDINSETSSGETATSSKCRNGLDCLPQSNSENGRGKGGGLQFKSLASKRRGRGEARETSS